MKDKELDRIIREALSYEDEKLMDIVRNEPSLADVKAPDSLKEKLFAQIEEYKEEQARIEEQERVKRLERKYKRAVRWNKALVIVAALVAVMALGITSMGGPKRVLEEFKRKIGGREQTVVDSDDSIQKQESSNEVDAFEKIEKAFGHYPVRMDYISSGVYYLECVLEKETQNARMYYESEQGITICYMMIFNNRIFSSAVDTEDSVEKSFVINLKDAQVEVLQLKIGDSNLERWRAEFIYKDVIYYIEMNGVKETEVKKIIENLYFP